MVLTQRDRHRGGGARVVQSHGAPGYEAVEGLASQPSRRSGSIASMRRAIAAFRARMVPETTALLAYALDSPYSEGILAEQ